MEENLTILRARVEALEAENAELRRRTDEVIASSRRQADTLERVGLDLNELMRKPGAKEVRAAIRAVRWVYRQLRWQLPKRYRDARAGARVSSR